MEMNEAYTKNTQTAHKEHAKSTRTCVVQDGHAADIHADQGKLMLVHPLHHRQLPRSRSEHCRCLLRGFDGVKLHSEQSEQSVRIDRSGHVSQTSKTKIKK